jgi:excisionase family DNA binding protein
MSKPTIPPESDILTVEEVASYLKVTQRSIYNLLARKKLPAFRVGGSWRFRRDEIEAMTRGKPQKQRLGKKPHGN